MASCAKRGTAKPLFTIISRMKTCPSIFSRRVENSRQNRDRPSHLNVTKSMPRGGVVLTTPPRQSGWSIESQISRESVHCNNAVSALRCASSLLIADLKCSSNRLVWTKTKQLSRSSCSPRASSVFDMKPATFTRVVRIVNSVASTSRPQGLYMAHPCVGGKTGTSRQDLLSHLDVSIWLAHPSGQTQAAQPQSSFRKRPLASRG